MMRTFRLSLTLGLLLTVAACASQNTGVGGNPDAPNGGDTANSSATAISSTILPRPSGVPPTQANQASPDSTAVRLRPVKWTRAEAGDGKRLLIYYTVGGRRECSLLGRVDVTETTTTVTATVLLGQASGADCGGAQTMIAASYVTP
jgi:hypothetical protein